MDEQQQDVLDTGLAVLDDNDTLDSGSADDKHPCQVQAVHPQIADLLDLLELGFNHIARGLRDFRRLAEKNIPDHAGFSFGFKARRQAHSRIMQLLSQRRRRAKRQVRWYIL